MFDFCFDGLTALGAMLAFQILAFVRNSPATFRVPSDIPPISLPILLIVFWLFIFLVLSVPYWFMLLIFHFAYFKAGFWGIVFGNLSLIIACLVLLFTNSVEQSERNYQSMPDSQIRLEFDWEFHMHLTRVAAILLLTFLLSHYIIIPLALSLSYIELYPLKALRSFGGFSTLEDRNKARKSD